MPSAKPTQPPAGADMSALVKRVNDLSVKAGLPAFTSKLPIWKRWIGGEKPEFDGSGLRDVVKTNADFLDRVKGDVDTHSQAIIEIRGDIQALQEAPAARPFP